MKRRKAGRTRRHFVYPSAEVFARRVRYFGKDDDFRMEIGEVVAGLPVEVAEFVVGKCAFVGVGRLEAGAAVHMRDLRRSTWLIALYENVPARDRRAVIARQLTTVFERHMQRSDLPPTRAAGELS